MEKTGNARPVLARVAAFFDSREEMALRLGVNKITVNTWFTRGYVPPSMAPAVSASTGGRVSIEMLVTEAAEAIREARLERKVRARLAAQQRQEGGRQG